MLFPEILVLKAADTLNIISSQSWRCVYACTEEICIDSATSMQLQEEYKRFVQVGFHLVNLLFKVLEQ